MPTVGVLETPRLVLLPTDARLARALVTDRRRAAALCGALLHRDFPDHELGRMLPGYAAGIEAVEGDGSAPPTGWGLWLVIYRRDRLVVGGIGFKGPPSARGEIAVGYGIVRAHRRRGLAAEGTAALVRWAFVDARVSRVTAECHVDNTASFGVLRRVGFVRLPDVSAAQNIRWELPRADWRQGTIY